MGLGVESLSKIQGPFSELGSSMACKSHKEQKGVATDSRTRTSDF